MPFVGEIYDARGGLGEWEILSLPDNPGGLYKMKRLSDGLEGNYNDWELANWFTPRRIKLGLATSQVFSRVIAPSSLWKQYYDTVWGLNSVEPMPKIETHVCTYVKYDTGLPNSRVFEYCKVCDKEKE